MTDQPVLLGALTAFAAAAVGHLVSCRPSTTKTPRWPTAPFAIGFALITWMIIDRWIEVDHPPFKTLYESLLLLVWCGSALYLLLLRLVCLPLVGAGLSAVLAGALGYAGLKANPEPVQLPPALQSPWFIPHVLAYFLAYGILLLATIAAIASLFQAAPPIGDRGGATPAPTRQLGYGDLMHRGIVCGFCLLTVGLILGCVWARAAWGDYWTWDPKESWALVSWLAYGLYLHTAQLPGWDGRRSAWIAILAFGTILFTYLGMHLLPVAGKSVHVYQYQ